MKVLISNEQNLVQINEENILALAKNIMQEEKFEENSELSLVFCDDLAIKDLNKQFRNKDEPTDVLSFPLPRNEFKGFKPATILVGDVVISVETAARQAKEMGHELMDEITLLLIHGLLHLAGYDHINAQDKEKMLHRELKLYKKFSFPNYSEELERSFPNTGTIIGRTNKV